MRLIDADKLVYEDIKCVDGNTYMVVHAPEIDNAPTIAFPFSQEEEPKKVIRKNYLYFCPSCGAKLRYRNSNGCRRKNLGKYCEHCGTRIEYPME